MTAETDLVAELGGRVAGADPRVLARWLENREPRDVVHACVMDLDDDQRAGFLEAWAEPWSAVLIANARHPSLTELADYARRHDGTILLASPSGPPPPAVLVIEAPDA